VIGFLEVGQGDCTVVVDTVARRALVIDCPQQGVQAAEAFLRNYEIEQLDLIIVTHLDLDHFGGVGRLAESCRPAQLLVNPGTPPSPPTDRSDYRIAVKDLARLHEQGITTLDRAKAGLACSVGGVACRLIAPEWHNVILSLLRSTPDRNRASAIVRIEIRDLAVLVGGDAVGSVWREIARKSPGDLPAHVLRSPHHGGAVAGDFATILKVIKPGHLVHSLGPRNSYGHPNRT
jgi:competence protein ComEC